jgi:serine protease Do
VTDPPAAFKATTHPLVPSGDIPVLEQINRENIRVVGAALPSLVRITSMMQVDPHAQLLDFPFHFPGLPHGVKSIVPSYGSGVIISRDGYIVTNYHVIRDARNVDVQMHDKSTFPARIIASDQETDIAVLKIDATDLTAMPWGNSDRIQVGEQVFALGNPFNLDTSVSKGIISGIGRNLPDVEPAGGEARPEYQDYIQTDAAINMGNSGGALINIHGEIIGINAAIASFTQGSEGVGFSIPSNLVRSTVEQLIRQGKLVRGYLGVRLPVKVDEGVSEQLGLDSNRGALLAGIQRSSPADQARLRPVDCIVEVDGHKIDSLPQFRLIVAQIPVGKQIVVNYIRAGSPRTATVKIAELPKETVAEDSALPPDAASASGPPVADTASPGDQVLAGVHVGELDDKSRPQFGVDDFITSGVVVTGVQEGSPADLKGLLRGDVVEVACAQRGAIQTLAHPSDFATLVKGLKPDQSVVLLVHHGKLSGQEDRSSTFLYLSPNPK